MTISSVNLRATPDGRLALRDAAVYLGLAPKTLQNRTTRGLAPASVKVGGRRFFYLAELQAFVAGDGAK